MSDPFRRLFLDQVNLIIQKEPSRESLLALLQLATPGLVDLGGTRATEKTFKTLTARVHPDKHPRDTERATSLCQDARCFYDKCLASSPSKKKTKRSASSPSSVSLPLEFNAINKWPHIEYSRPHTMPEMVEDVMSRSVAYQCINARGAIAHGRKIEYSFDNEDSETRNPAKSVEWVFSSFGGAKELCGATEIKEEILKNGPVVSTTFCPSDTFLSNHAIGKSIHCHQSGILVVGWKQLSSGEVWIVQPLYRSGGLRSQVAYVAVGQFGIDDCCLAPKNDLQDTPWQPGPYYDGSMVGVESKWQTWTSIEFHLVSVDNLFKETGSTNLINPNNVVTVRDKTKIAHSKKANLSSITWDSAKNKFCVLFTFVE
mmetsp:Transcript_23036/g.49873  ORF Transcript_23036/g.49873 Transcript_23036/m.49873 type:complete len:371 (+) Transcript_23036:26-1138(+)